MKETIIVQQEIEISYKDEVGRQKAKAEILKSSNWMSFYYDWTDSDKAAGLTRYGAVKKDDTIFIVV